MRYSCGFMTGEMKYQDSFRKLQNIITKLSQDSPFIYLSAGGAHKKCCVLNLLLGRANWSESEENL